MHCTNPNHGQFLKAGVLCTCAAVAEFEAQQALEPGQCGWWKVWGARPVNIRPGDIVICKAEEGGTETMYVEDTYASKAAPMRIGIVVEGEEFTLGAFQPIVLVRRGIHNTLA